MKKSLQKTLFTSFIALFCVLVSEAQSITIQPDMGSGDLSKSEKYQFLPVSFSGGAKVQVLFSQQELLDAGFTAGAQITAIEWYVSTDNTPIDITFDVYLYDDYTAATMPATEKEFIDSSDFVLVADDIVDAGQFDSSWHTATFDTPFVWDGTDNLIIQVCRPGSTSEETNHYSVADRIFYYYVDDNVFVTGHAHISCDETEGNYTENYRPSLRFVVTESSLSTPELALIKAALYPNPAENRIQIGGLTQDTEYAIYNVMGALITKGVIAQNQHIDVSAFEKGIYFVQLNNTALSFIKE